MFQDGVTNASNSRTVLVSSREVSLPAPLLAATNLLSLFILCPAPGQHVPGAVLSTVLSRLTDAVACHTPSPLGRTVPVDELITQTVGGSGVSAL